MTDDALQRYEKLRSLSPKSADPALELLIAHEKALKAFAAAELEQPSDQSLEPVRDVMARLGAL